MVCQSSLALHIFHSPIKISFLPGSLSQHELRGEERTPKATKKRSSKTPKDPTPTVTNLGTLDADQVLMLMNLMSSQAQPQQAPQPPKTTPELGIPAEWLIHLANMTPILAPFLPPVTSPSASSEMSSSETENAGTPEPVVAQSALENVLEAMMSNNNNNNNNGTVSEQVPETSTVPPAIDLPSTSSEAKEDEKEELENSKDLLVKAVGPAFLSVSTEQPISNSMTSGPESGICTNTPSPVSSEDPSPVVTSSSTATLDLVKEAIQNAKRAQKRRSVDNICFELSKRFLLGGRF
uniref:Uncharacterized protein n=1 Tax=Caenorhabditis japonica TaxID=281687 RepID=A0A8R1DGI4_CAEJA